MKSKPLIAFKKQLHGKGIETIVSKEHMHCSKQEKSFSFYIVGENFDFQNHKKEHLISFDRIVCEPKKVEAVLLSKLKLNETIFARKCEIRKVTKETATEFLDMYHLMNATQSAFNLGLYNNHELVALASFSKGRKMNRLLSHQRSFELIRFCTKSGITVTGGLTRLIKRFCVEKKVGDVMTYVDKQLSDGRSFITAGFKKHSETEPNYFLINKTNFERIPFNKTECFDHSKFYLTQNSGNIKLVYTPLESI